jgi:serine protease Do
MCRPVRGAWLWVTIIIVVLVVGGMMPLAFRSRGGGSPPPAAVRSFLGVDGFENAPGGGAFIEGIAGVGAPIERAGMIGGDIITAFDGKKIEDAGDMREAVRTTPPGKTVEVTYVRDGETKKAKLVTVSEEENSRLEEAFEDRPQPQGFLGVDDDMERVEVPGTKIHGVRLKQVFKNRPAYIAGLRDGDVVIEFDGVPIRTPQELNRRIDRALPDSTVKVVVMRGSERIVVPVKVGRSKD